MVGIKEGADGEIHLILVVARTEYEGDVGG